MNEELVGKVKEQIQSILPGVEDYAVDKVAKEIIPLIAGEITDKLKNKLSEEYTGSRNIPSCVNLLKELFGFLKSLRKDYGVDKKE